MGKNYSCRNHHQGNYANRYKYYIYKQDGENCDRGDGILNLSMEVLLI